MTIYNEIINETHKIFVKIQNKENVQDIDIPNDLDLKLADAQEQLAQIIEEIVEYQKNSTIHVVEIAASGGQYFMNGIPLIFTLFQYENQQDDRYWLKIEMETTVDEKFYGKEYVKTKKILDQYNKHPYGSYDVEQLNKIVSHYTYDYADFEYNEEDNEWHGNIY